MKSARLKSKLKQLSVAAEEEEENKYKKDKSLGILC